MALHQLPKLKGKKRAAKRIGRGYGSGKGGHTVGRGAKGQKARGQVRLGFEGGQLPLYKRLPHKRGFKRAFRDEVVILNVGRLEKFEPGSVVSPQALIEAGFFRAVPKGGVKILGEGEVSKKLIIENIKLSETAKDKILKAGGDVR